MLQSSELIAALAAALARAQLELTNPEKSLTATIPAASPREEARTYRYASLATGLDIVRKSLGRQEIAAVQSTVIDQQTGLVRLMTVLAHSSGEWLSSEWPVCPVTETANPQRMGAALTYARRYALFTLVGIAGEDDLDAPEPSRPTAASTSKGGTITERATLPATRGRYRSIANGSRPSTIQPAGASCFQPEDSQALREALLAELALIQSTDGLSRWAYRRLRSKNILQDGDARAVESAFQVKIDTAGEPELATSGEIETTAEANDNAPTPSMAAGGPPIDPAVPRSDGRPREMGRHRGQSRSPASSRATRRRAEGVQLGLGCHRSRALSLNRKARAAARTLPTAAPRNRRLPTLHRLRPKHRRQRRGGPPSTRACFISMSPNGFETRSTSATWRRSLASCAAHGLLTLITPALPSRGRSVAR